MTSNFSIVIGDTDLRGEAAGSGRCVIMLHAGVADRRMWGDSLEFLAHNYLAVAYDRRGYGETRAADEAFRHIDDLDRIIQYFSAERPILVGCSQGGAIAIDYVLAHPGKIAAVVLVATAVSGAPSPSEYPPAISALLAQLFEAEKEHYLERVNAIETHLWLDGPMNAEGRIQGDKRKLFFKMNGIALRHAPLTHEQPCSPAMERLASIKVPTLIVWGDYDFPHIQERSKLLVKTIPGAKSMTMQGCAHLPNLEQPMVFNAAIERFLKASI